MRLHQSRPNTVGLIAALLAVGVTHVARGELLYVSNGSAIARFDSASLGVVTSVPIVGMQPGEVLVGMDLRPLTAELYGVGSAGRLYLLNPFTGAATLSGTPGAFTLNGTAFGSDFNPVVDRLRVVSNTEQNLRLHPDTAVPIIDSPLNPAGNVVAVAYDRNVARDPVNGGPATTLYAIDSVAGTLGTIGGVNGVPSPNGGTRTTIGSLGMGTNLNENVGFDISGASGVGFATITTAGNSRLYSVNLTTGAATLLGSIGTGTTPYHSVTSSRSGNEWRKSGANNGGNWSDVTHWSGGSVPLPSGVAHLLAHPSIDADLTINLDVSPTVSTLVLSNDGGAGKYTIAGANTLHIQTSAAAIYSTGGSHDITAPLDLAADTAIVVRGNANTLRAGNLLPAGVNITKSGDGSFEANHVQALILNVNAGSVRVTPSGGANAGTSRLTSVSASGARFDITDNRLILTGQPIGSWSGSGYTGVLGLIAQGRSGGTWSGNGIVTSMPDALVGGSHTIGVATAGDAGLSFGSFGGIGTFSTDVLVRYTFIGDTNLDGVVNFADLLSLAKSYNTAGGSVNWAHGDTNYDGDVDFDDLLGLAKNYNKVSAAAFEADWSLAQSLVPEPSTLLLATSAIALARRRRTPRSDRSDQLSAFQVASS